MNCRCATMRWVLAMVVVLATFSLEGAENTSRAVWPMYRGGPQRTGQSPFKGPAPMRVKWQVDLKREICASPAVGPDGTIYVGAGAIFYAITSRGEVLWSHNFADGNYSRAPARGTQSGDNQGFTSPSPALAPDGTIYQACGRGKGKAGNGFVIALDPSPNAQKRIKWTFKTNREMRSSPLVALGDCFVGDAMVVALDSAGNRKWEGGKAAFLGVTSSPALSPNGMTLYIGGFDGRLHALDAKTGAEKWSAGPKKSSPLCFPQWDAEDKQISRFTTSGYIPEAPAVGPDGTIYFGSWDGHLYAAAPHGDIRWKIDLKDRVSSAPAVSTDGHVLVSTFEGILFAVRGGGTVDWQAGAKSRYSSPLISSDGKVYVGGLDGKLRAYALKTGKPLGELAFEGWIYASPVPGGDGVLYVGASDGYLRAVASTGELPAPAPPETARQEVVEKRERESAPKRIVALRPVPPKRTGTRPPGALSYDQALKLAREYMDSEDAAKRAEILQKAEGYSERLDEIAAAVRPVPSAHARTGYIPEDKFTVPTIRARMARIIPRPEGPVLPFVPPKGSSLKGPAPGEEHLNWVYVPENYDPRKPLGLVISLHGGAGSNPQSSAGDVLGGKENPLRRGDFIAVCPSGPPMVDSWGSCKFQYPESEIHIQSVIEEYSTRYAVDPNRVFLTGFSMGGIGSWWHAFRQADRFALIAPMSGAWRAAYWPRLRGTFLYLMHGAFDHHGTHVDFDRCAHERMGAIGIPHIEAEFLGAHGPGMAQQQKEALFELYKAIRRDPYCPHVCAISPFILDSEEMRRRRYPPQPYSFWVSVLEAGPDGVPVEQQIRNTKRAYEGGRDGDLKWERNMFAANRVLIKAGAVDAENLGENRFRVKTTNVKRFALWLHPKMGVDFGKPIEIELVQMGVDLQTSAEVERGRRRVTATARPSLAAMLTYLGDRRDYGLIYHAVVEVDIE